MHLGDVKKVREVMWSIQNIKLSAGHCHFCDLMWSRHDQPYCSILCPLARRMQHWIWSTNISLSASASPRIWLPKVRRNKKRRTSEVIKWMIHLRKQISEAALSLTPERIINSVEGAGTQPQDHGSSHPDRTVAARHPPAQTTAGSHAPEKGKKRQQRKMS